MSLFDKFRIKKETITAESDKKVAPTEETNWDSLQNEPFAGSIIKKTDTITEITPERSNNTIKEPGAITEITPERSNEILQKTTVDGDPFTFKGQDYTLTPEILKESGLAPQYEYKLGETNVSLSEIFKVRGHDAVIAYIEDEKGETKARSYYRSNSTGLWRYCPDYGYNDGIRIWFGKGFGEESLTLPHESQKNISSIQKKDDFKPNIPIVCFFGTAKRYASARDYDYAKFNDKLSGDYPKEVSRYANTEFPKYEDDKTPPEHLDIKGDKTPVFHNEITSYQMNSDLYGNFTVRVFPSVDKQLLYSMCETEENGIKKAWIGNIETTSPIGSTGLHKEWVSPGDIGTPLYEYPEQSGSYGDNYDEKHGYVGMWNDYLSKSPLIKRYLDETNKR